MKKILLLLCLFTISFNSIAASETDAREFITGFFQAIKGNDWKLSPECLGPASKAKMPLLLSALMSGDWQKAQSILAVIAIEAKNECPFEDLLEFKNRLAQELAEGKLVEDMRSNTNQIIRILGETFNSHAQKTTYTFGKALGSIASLVLYHKQHNSLAFLELAELAPDTELFLAVEELKITKEEFDKFFKGLLIGVSKVPYQENKCYKEVSGSLDEIKAASLKVYEAVFSRNVSDFTAGLSQLTSALLKIKAYDENCKVTQLIKSISFYSSSYTGLAKLIYNIATNGGKYYDLTKQMIEAVKENNFEKGGESSGKIIKILLNWETN